MKKHVHIGAFPVFFYFQLIKKTLIKKLLMRHNSNKIEKTNMYWPDHEDEFSVGKQLVQIGARLQGEWIFIAKPSKTTRVISSDVECRSGSLNEKMNNWRIKLIFYNSKHDNRVKWISFIKFFFLNTHLIVLNRVVTP